jgi:hypothetical protein
MNKKNKFGYNEIILHKKLLKEEEYIGHLENYYLETFNNVRFLDAQISKWGLLDLAKNAIYHTITQR